jgi:hypothetical protein
VSSHSVVEVVALIAEREAARVESRVDLAQPAARSRIADQELRVNGVFTLDTETRRVYPEGSHVLDFGGEEVGSGAVGSDLLGNQTTRRLDG